MTAKPVIQRRRASEDVDAALEHYLGEATRSVALGFVDALHAAYGHIGEYPASGSTRYGYELGIPGLRSWKLKRYPYIVFYLERDPHIEVYRVLNDQRDIPSWLTQTE